MNRQSTALVGLLAMMGVTAFALVNFVDVALEDQPGVRMNLPGTMGEWKGTQLKFCHAKECRKEFTVSELGEHPGTCPGCGNPLFNMSFAEWDQLPKDTAFVKSRYANPDEDTIFVSVVLTGRDRESIHRPERCLIGQGHRIETRTTMDVPLGDGQNLKIALIKTRRQWETGQGTIQGAEGYFAYWFVGQNRETYSHWLRMGYLAWDRVVNSVAHKWAYVALAGRRDPGSDLWERKLRNFVPLLHRAIVLTPDEIKAARRPASGGESPRASVGEPGDSSSTSTRNPTSQPR